MIEVKYGDCPVETGRISRKAPVLRSLVSPSVASAPRVVLCPRLRYAGTLVGGSDGAFGALARAVSVLYAHRVGNFFFDNSFVCFAFLCFLFAVILSRVVPSARVDLPKVVR
jgi:hypothetical protein